MKNVVMLVVGCCVVAGQALGATLYVSKLGDNSDGSSWAKAFNTIQKALATQLATTIVERWRDRVRQDHQLHPFTDEEQTRGGLGGFRLRPGATGRPATLVATDAGLAF